MADRATLPPHNGVGYHAVETCLRLRLAMLNAGSMGPARMPEAEDIGETGLAAILPGSETIVRLWYEDRAELAQVHHADGEPMCEPMDLRDPVQTALLMHNIDCTLACQHMDAPLGRIMRTADALYGASLADPQTAQLVQHWTRAGTALDLGDWSGRWMAGECIASLYKAAAGLGVGVSRTDFDDFSDSNMLRWRDNVVGWVLGARVATPLWGNIWRAMPTLVHVRAACIKLRPQYEPMVPWHPFDTPGMLPQGHEFWILEREDAEFVLMAHRQGPVIMLAAREDDPDAAARHYRADVLLLGEALLSQPADPGAGPAIMDEQDPSGGLDLE